MFQILDCQPIELEGFEYTGSSPAHYTWMQFISPEEEEPYAYAGVAYKGIDAWMYWRIQHSSLAGWKDLKRVVVPALNAYFKSLGVKMVYCSSVDAADVNFDKMIAFMNFKPIKMGMQEVV